VKQPIAGSSRKRHMTAIQNMLKSIPQKAEWLRK